MTTPGTGRALSRLVGAACVRPAITVGLALALAAGSIWYSVSALFLNTSELALLPPNAAYIQRSVQYDREFREVDALVIAVEAPSVAEGKAYAGRLAQELRARRVPLRRVTYRADPGLLDGHALLYLSTEQLIDLRGKLFDHEAFVQSFAARPTLDAFIQGVAGEIAAEFASRFLDLGLDDARSGPDLRFVSDLVSQLSSRLANPAPYRSLWDSAISLGRGDEASEGYFLSEDERLLFVLAEPRSEAGSFTDNARAIEGTRGAIAALRPEYPRVRVGVTGRPALSNDEMTRAFSDSQVATVVALVLTLAVLLAAFRQVAKPLLMLLVLAISLCWSIGVATAVVGHLSLFSVMFVSIVIGIGIDYGIYYLFRYEEERSRGREVADAIAVAAVRGGPGMLAGALTAAGTFYVLTLTEFRGLQELGFIAGSAILCAWLAMMTVFPALLLLWERSRGPHAAVPVARAGGLQPARSPLLTWFGARKGPLVAVAALLTLLSFWGSWTIRFDYNLLHLQAKETESVRWERRILEGGRSSFAAFSRAVSLEELQRTDAMFRRLRAVARVDSALALLPADQEEKLQIVSRFPPFLTQVKVRGEMPVHLERLLAALGTLRRRLELGASEAPPGEAKLELRRASEETANLIGALRRQDDRASERALAALQHDVYLDFTRGLERLRRNLAPRKIDPGDLPADFRRQFVSEQGGFLLHVYPAVDIWDRAGAQRFAGELRTVDPDVTGPAIITFETVRLMERSYREATLYAIVLVSVVAFVMLRRGRETALALLPLGLGLAWTGGLMGLLGLDVTMGNVFGLPLILGGAAEYGLNIVLSFVNDGEQGSPLLARSTNGAVLTSGLTTIAGFGSLLVASHRGIFGLGLLLTIGTVTTLVASLIVLPTLLLSDPGRRPCASRARPRGPRPCPP
jgi:hopanoid biosynthesis associated RND transporter like protein HpnN